MQLYDLKQELKENKLRNLYIFSGPEVGIMDAYLDKMKSIAKSEITTVESFRSIYGTLSTYRLLDDKLIYRIKDDKGLESDENLWPELKSLQTDNITILIFTGLRRNGKFFKYFEDLIVEFDRLTIEQLSKYVQKELGVNQQYANILAKLCDQDYSRLMLECNKIKHFKESCNYSSYDEALKDAVNSGLIYQSSKDVIFDLVNAVMKNNKKLAFENLEEYEEVNESILGFLSLLYNNFRQLLMVQGLGSKENVAERTGLTGFQVKLANERSGIFQLAEIIKNLETIRYVDSGIKNGSVDPHKAGDFLLCQILK